MSRDKYTTTWQNPASIVTYSLIERIHAGSSKLFYFYAEPQPGLYANMYVKQRDLSGSTRSSPTLLMEHSDFYSPFVSATNTTDGKTHIVYSGPGSTVYRNFNGSSWSSALTIGDNFEKPEISSVSNDLYVIWRGYDGYLKYRQYDAIPLAPQNLTVTKSAANHPLLSWSKNNEADLQNYKIYKYSYAELGWQYYGSSTTNSFEDLNETYVTGGAVANEHWVYYKVTAVDMHPYESPASNQVGARVKGAGLEKISGATPAEYYLDQNFPNPFNPSTKIAYSIKEEGLVTLKIYDILGKEIVALVNESKPAGIYEAEFNASLLPSGMYIYKIQSGQFSDVKKMLLTK